jgi:hypothetical protein
MESLKLETIGTKHIDWREIFDYFDGNLYWNEVAPARVRNKLAGYMTGPYLKVRYEGRAYMLHRIIYEMHNGAFEGFIDHIDRNKLNNRIENLRVVTKSENELNCTKRVTNTSGYKGVYFSKQFNKWRAKIDKDKKQIHIGYYDDVEEAALAYNKKAFELFGEIAYQNVI